MHCCRVAVQSGLLCSIQCIISVMQNAVVLLSVHSWYGNRMPFIPRLYLALQGTLPDTPCSLVPLPVASAAHQVQTMQVGFHSNKLVTKVKVEKRINEVINRLNRTKQELYPDLAAERETYDRGVRLTRKSELQVSTEPSAAVAACILLRVVALTASTTRLTPLLCLVCACLPLAACFLV